MKSAARVVNDLRHYWPLYLMALVGADDRDASVHRFLVNPLTSSRRLSLDRGLR